MLREINIKDALERYLGGEDVKVLVPILDDPTNWAESTTAMLSDLLGNLIYMAEEVKLPEPETEGGIVFADEPPIETDDTKPETDPDGRPIEYVSVPCVAPMDEESEAEPKPVKKPGPKKDIDDGKIRALFETGHWTVADIADEMGISQATVYNHLKKMGVDLTK